MLKIGIDKTDKSYRHFEYDDERRYGNPQVYKVLYEESGAFGEVLCSNVISIKKSNNVHNHFLDIPIYNDVKNDVVEKTKTKVDEVVVSKEEPKEKKKSKSTKSKQKVEEQPKEQVKTVNVKDFFKEQNESPTFTFIPKSYIYDVLVIDNISDIDDIKYKLNELGKDGWEVCGFQTTYKVFGCQAIFIMKKGLI